MSSESDMDISSSAFSTFSESLLSLAVPRPLRMTPLVFRTTVAMEFDVLAAAPLRVDRDEDAAAANEVEVELRAD